MTQRLRRGRDAWLLGASLWAGCVLMLAPAATAQAPVPKAEPAEHPAAVVLSSPAEIRLKDDVAFLADDAQEGRAPGTLGIEAAAAHIASRFLELGLQPAPGAEGYYQAFTLPGAARPGEPTDLRVDAPDDVTLTAEPGADFNVLAIGVTGEVQAAPIVFAGYGITADVPAKHLKYDDYEGVDAKGKAVLILRREPRQNDDDSPFDGRRTSDFATVRHKATNAFQHGASLILLVNDLAGTTGDVDAVLSLGAMGTDTLSRLPILHVSRGFADKVLKAAGEPTLAELEADIDADLKPRSRELPGIALTAHATVDRPAIETRNVVGVLEGAGPNADETIVVGAHYDHLGRGGPGSGSLVATSTDIHNGADDNASGTALILELARRMALRGDLPPRRIVFIAFSGEERGLLGSDHYVENPLFPLESTVAMFNFDMVGRLNEQNELTMIGTGTASGFADLVETLGKDSGLAIKQVAGMTDGFGGSDHQSFYKKDIPILFAFTGIHTDYHRPSDDWDRINYAGMARIADYVELILLNLTRRPARPEFVQVSAPSGHGESQSASTSMSVTLGVMPDYADESKSGMKLSGVREGGPAAKAGIQGGDVLISIGGKPIGTIYDYMESLGRYQPGDSVDVVVLRDGSELTLRVDLVKSNAPPRQ